MQTKFLLGALLASVFSCSTQAAVATGAADQTTGLSWIKASNLSEGEALGYRAASTAEFSAYLTNGGFGAIQEGQEFSARTVPNSLMGFAPDATLPSTMIYEYAPPIVSMGLLDGRTDQVGAMLYTTGRQLTECPGTTYYSCYMTIYRNEAAVGSLGEMLDRQHDRIAYGTGGDWAGTLATLKQTDGSYKLSYFMVTSVPESGTWVLMSLGMLALAGTAVRRRKQT